MTYVIPAIDIIDGSVVRLYQGDYGKVTRYDFSPTEIACSLKQQGFSHLHVIDLLGAKKGSNSLLTIIKELKGFGLKIQVGGGIRTVEDATRLIDAGASKVIVSTSALEEPKFLSELIDAVGAEKVIVSLDVRKGFVATRGWLKDTDQTPAQCLKRLPGIKHVIITDISRDGTLSADVNLALYSTIAQEFPHIHLIAAGGVCSFESVSLLGGAGCEACVVGKAFFDVKGLREKFIAMEAHCDDRKN